ncbi:hypothetical protein J0383_19455 [Flavobacterium endoglycinae]|uniref:Uncharacterized protein n=1 Tax=Flavobacterium endoglycinae TaxID=2816357 RepID=A0ABX7QD30_9FLAO|nr:hypothetical protein [Flavobacterium endoglycinae]QSW88418.1 hypothetical protein J0383_19455 [Flavobacterium endoglycinae]
MKNYMYCLALIVFCTMKLHAQTVGVGEVSAIESKAGSIEAARLRILQIESELPQLEKLWQDKLQKLRSEIEQIYKDRDNLIADMKAGARCSKCNEWKSEFEKKGQSFEKHLGEVKGYAIPATTSELETARKGFSEKIAILKVQLKNLEKGDNTILKKNEQIQKLKDDNDRLCQEITLHSKNYEMILLNDSKAKHKMWSDELMASAVKTLISDDKITICKAKIPQIEKEFQNLSEEIREKLKNDNEKLQQSKNNSISSNEQKINNIQTVHQSSILQLQEQLQKLEALKNDLQKELSSDSIAARLEMTGKQLVVIRDSITELEKQTKDSIALLQAENKKLNAEIWSLKTDLPNEQQKALLPLKEKRDAKKKETELLHAAAISELAENKKSFAEKTAQCQKNNDVYTTEISMECTRMYAAGQKVGCSVYNSIKGTVVSNWNETASCVKAVASLAKPYSTNVFNAYCKGQDSSGYMSGYKSFLASLSSEDKLAVKEASNADWFELMMR